VHTIEVKGTGSAAAVNSSGFMEEKRNYRSRSYGEFHHDSSFLPYRLPNVCGFLAKD
jgi:hypothetical protein